MRNLKLSFLVGAICISTVFSASFDPEEDYRRYLNDPKLVMNLATSEREDVVSRIKDYTTIVLNLEGVRKTIAEGDGVVDGLRREAVREKLAIATSLHNFYLDLQYKGQERSQALIEKKALLMQSFEAISSSVGERKDAARIAYLELDARIRKEERSMFGAIKDAFVGRDIPPAPVDPSIRMIEEELQRNMTATVIYLDNQIESWRNQNEQVALSLAEAGARIQLLELPT